MSGQEREALERKLRESATEVQALKIEIAELERAALAAREEPPGPPKPPLVPGHMGQPDERTLRNYRAVFGALGFLDDFGMDVGEMRKGWLGRLEGSGLRESDLIRKVPPQVPPPSPVGLGVAMDPEKISFRRVAMSVDDWQRLLEIARFGYTPQDERILNAIQTALAESMKQSLAREDTERPDRRVHARSALDEVVRYERAGKWFLEVAHDSEPKESVRVSVREAAAEALRIVATGGTIYLGLPGGTVFDRIVRGHA